MVRETARKIPALRAEFSRVALEAAEIKPLPAFLRCLVSPSMEAAWLLTEPLPLSRILK